MRRQATRGAQFNSVKNYKLQRKTPPSKSAPESSLRLCSFGIKKLRHACFLGLKLRSISSLPALWSRNLPCRWPRTTFGWDAINTRSRCLVAAYLGRQITAIMKVKIISLVILVCNDNFVIAFRFFRFLCADRPRIFTMQLCFSLK